MVALAVTGCKDEDLAPIVTQDNLLFGAFPRLIELRTGEFDLDDLQGSSYEMEVDFVDNAEGADVAQYNVYIAFDDNSTSGGRQDYSTESTLFRSYEPSDFRAGPNGNLGIDVVIPFTEAANFAGVPLDSIFSGDRFQVTTEVVKTDGRVFGSGNSTPAITSAFNGIFDFNIVATCPLPDDMFTGEYTITYGYVYDEIDPFGNTPIQALGNPPFSRTVTLGLVEGSTTRRTFNPGAYLQPYYSFNPGNVTLEFACDVVTSGAIDSGAGCGSGTIAAEQNGTASFDLTDDSTFTIEYNDWASDGGCQVAPLGFSLVFTKN